MNFSALCSTSDILNLAISTDHENKWKWTDSYMPLLHTVWFYEFNIHPQNSFSFCVPYASSYICIQNKGLFHSSPRARAFNVNRATITSPVRVEQHIYIYRSQISNTTSIEFYSSIPTEICFDLMTLWLSASCFILKWFALDRAHDEYCACGACMYIRSSIFRNTLWLSWQKSIRTNSIM